MSGFGTYDPVGQMKLEEKEAVVELDRLQQKARDWLEEKTRDKLGKSGQVLPLEFHPHSQVLKSACSPIPALAFKTSLLKKLVEDMHFTMYLCGGVGLATPQVGLKQRMFVADWTDDKSKPLVIANPEVTWQSEDVTREREACLSMPGVKLNIVRPTQIKANFHTELGNRLEDVELEGWAARVFLHELEHLDGKMMIDHPTVGRVERRMAAKVPQRIARGEKAKKPKQKRKKKPRR